MKNLYEKYKAHKDRVEGEAQVEIYTALEKWAADKSRSQVAKILQDAGLLAEPVRNDREVYESPHYRERGTVRWLDDPLFGDMVLHAATAADIWKKPRDGSTGTGVRWAPTTRRSTMICSAFR